MAKQRLQVCIDRVVPDEVQPARAAAERAIRELPANFVPGRARMAIPQVKKWPNNLDLNCRFLDGSATQRKRVEDHAHSWEQFANIRFRYVQSGAAEIRISFSADPGSWSALGTDALNAAYFPLHEPTMNYGWLEDDTNDDEYRRVVVHEFGHALGAIHEHQQPNASLRWNTDEVYRTFSGPPNFWSPADIDYNVLQRYAHEHVNASEFDAASIMLYHFPGKLFLGGVGTPNNTKMSEMDKKFIQAMYPQTNPQTKK
jgi:hypothetical protein